MESKFIPLGMSKGSSFTLVMMGITFAVIGPIVIWLEPLLGAAIPVILLMSIFNVRYGIQRSGYMAISESQLIYKNPYFPLWNRTFQLQNIKQVYFSHAISVRKHLTFIVEVNIDDGQQYRFKFSEPYRKSLHELDDSLKQRGIAARGRITEEKLSIENHRMTILTPYLFLIALLLLACLKSLWGYKRDKDSHSMLKCVTKNVLANNLYLNLDSSDFKC